MGTSLSREFSKNKITISIDEVLMSERQLLNNNNSNTPIHKLFSNTSKKNSEFIYTFISSNPDIRLAINANCWNGGVDGKKSALYKLVTNKGVNMKWIIKKILENYSLLHNFFCLRTPETSPCAALCARTDIDPSVVAEIDEFKTSYKYKIFVCFSPSRYTGSWSTDFDDQYGCSISFADCLKYAANDRDFEKTFYTDFCKTHINLLIMDETVEPLLSPQFWGIYCIMTGTDTDHIPEKYRSKEVEIESLRSALCILKPRFDHISFYHGLVKDGRRERKFRVVGRLYPKAIAKMTICFDMICEHLDPAAVADIAYDFIFGPRVNHSINSKALYAGFIDEKVASHPHYIRQLIIRSNGTGEYKNGMAQLFGEKGPRRQPWIDLITDPEDIMYIVERCPDAIHLFKDATELHKEAAAKSKQAQRVPADRIRVDRDRLLPRMFPHLPNKIAVGTEVEVCTDNFSPGYVFGKITKCDEITNMYSICCDNDSHRHNIPRGKIRLPLPPTQYEPGMKVEYESRSFDRREIFTGAVVSVCGESVTIVGKYTDDAVDSTITVPLHDIKLTRDASMYRLDEYFVGDCIEAEYMGNWFSGTITSVSDDGKMYEIKYSSATLLGAGTGHPIDPVTLRRADEAMRSFFDNRWKY